MVVGFGGAALLLTDGTGRTVGADAHKPTSKSTGFLEQVKTPPCLDKGFLHDVFTVVTVAHDHVRSAEQAALVAFNKPFEGFDIAILGSQYQLPVVMIMRHRQTWCFQSCAIPLQRGRGQCVQYWQCCGNG